MALLRECLKAVRTLHGKNMQTSLSIDDRAVTFTRRHIIRARTPLPGTPVPMHSWVGFGGVQLTGDSWGDPKAPLVVLLHGVGQTRHAWGGTGMTLGAAGYYAVAFDARGHGDSDWASDGNYSRDAMIRDVQYLVSALGGRRPALVGASMGGAVSLVSVGEGLVDARALILVDIAPRTEPIGGIKIREFISRNVQGFCSLEEVAEAIDSYRPRQGHPRKLETLAKNVRLGADGKYYWHWDPQLMARAPDSSERLVESARRLALPTLLVRGGHSDLVSDEGVRDFLCLSPHSEYVNVVQAGHMVAREKNDVFERAVVEFLQRMVPASSAALPSKPS